MKPVPCVWTTLDFRGNPSELLDIFAGEPHLFLLQSSLYGSADGRFSFLGFDPYHIVRGDGCDAFSRLREEFYCQPPTEQSGFSPLDAGIVGFFSYELGMDFEEIRRREKPRSGCPGLHFGFYDTMISIDHYARRLYVSSSGFPETTVAAREKRARHKLDDITSRIRRGLASRRLNESEDDIGVSIHPAVTKEAYCRNVRSALERIADGDIYQVNLSQSFDVRLSGQIPATQLFARLQRSSPSRFGAFLDAGDLQVFSTSPERFLRLQNGIIQTRPMKGTRPRGRDLDDDLRLKEEIRHSDKDRAELLMVTDLERNDLGKICDYGSVRVEQLRDVEEYSTVFQTTSTIEGTLREGLDGFDAIRACFPGGSITGCPKIRSMQIIEELEDHRRGVYTGALGYMSFSGHMDLNILIRTLVKDRDGFRFHVGGGIVADSDPEKEYEETLIKSRGIVQTFERAAKVSSRPAYR